MTNAIAVGSILVERDIRFPGAFLLSSESDSNGWASVNGADPGFERMIQAAGWTFFYMAGRIRTTVFGFDGQKALSVAVGRLIANVKSQHCNSLEITEMAMRTFLSVPYVSVTAHARHLQKGMYFSG